MRATHCLFGVTSSPFHLQATLKLHTNKYCEQFPSIIEEFQSSTYVDDFDSGSDTVAEGYELVTTIQNILKEGGFNLRKFASNSDELNYHLNHSGVEKKLSSESENEVSYAERTQSSNEGPSDDSEQKVIGMVWNRKEDLFVFRFEKFLKIASDFPLTKKGLLKLITRIYDLLGLICPMLVSLKSAFRAACESSIHWDDKLSGEHIKLIKLWLENLRSIGSLDYPRYCLKFKRCKVNTAQLVSCSEASLSAFGTVIYLRVEAKDGIESNLVYAESCVSPKGQTLPSKELLGALLLAKGIDIVRKVIGSVIELGDEYLFSDSKTVLCWIKNRHERFKQFVEERCKSIRDKTNSKN